MTNAIDSIHNSEQGPQDGLTKREYFAGQALCGIMAMDNKNIDVSTSEEGYLIVAKHCVMIADFIINELNKTPTNDTP